MVSMQLDLSLRVAPTSLADSSDRSIRPGLGAGQRCPELAFDIAQMTGFMPEFALELTWMSPYQAVEKQLSPREGSGAFQGTGDEPVASPKPGLRAFPARTRKRARFSAPNLAIRKHQYNNYSEVPPHEGHGVS